MKFLFIIFFFLPTLLFGQLSKENDSTFVLTMNKQQMDIFYEKMVQYPILDSLLNLEKKDNKDYKNIISLKDTIIKKDSIVIAHKDKQLDSAQSWINREMSNKVDFFQGVFIGLKTESSNETNWRELSSNSFKYSLTSSMLLRIGKFDLEPGINLFLNSQKPTYFILIKYRIF